MPRSRRTPARDWPAFARLDPRIPVLIVGVVVLLAWSLLISADLLGLIGSEDSPLHPAWNHLFNNGPVEWMQWVLLAVAILLYGYVSGRLHDGEHPGAAAFFLFLGLGMSLMLVEETGDIRHVVGRYAETHIGPILGIPRRLYVDLPYFALLAVIPLYAVVRYGRYVWRARRTHSYIVVGVVFYALAAIGAALSHFRDLYVRLGRFVDTTLMGGRWPPRPNQIQDHAHFHLIDGPIEESIESFAAACLLGVALAFMWGLRVGQVAPERPLAAPAVSAPDPVRSAR